MTWLGYLCHVFALVDFAGMFFKYDLTGVSWSPIVAGLLGSLFLKLGEDGGNESTAMASLLLEDQRYKNALEMLIEDIERQDMDHEDREKVFDRAVTYLERQGIPSGDAKENLQLILAEVVAAAQKK
jgi:hypothetical protein